MLKIKKIQTEELKINYFEADAGQGWCFIGTNDSGVDSIVDIFPDAPGDSSNNISLEGTLGVFSFKKQQELFEEEVRNDNTDFMDKIDPGTLVKDFFSHTSEYEELLELCNLSGSLEKGYRQLSSGQSRKLCLLREITRGVSCLVVQNPYEGVDPASCRDIDQLFARLRTQGVLVLITINNKNDIPVWCTHLGVVFQGQLHLQGAIDEIIGQVDSFFIKKTGKLSFSAEEIRKEKQEQSAGNGELLVKLKDGFAEYSGRQVFSNLDLLIHEYEHTLITGPNGCGKSTLLQLITGDHPFCYRNNLEIFGIKRGSGESIWQLKQHMGLVSPDLHRNHYIPGSCLDVIVSGFFDSIGLYQRPTAAQIEVAKKWLHRLGLMAHARKPFRRQSYSRQRLLLIARALIKVPRMLILDEPTQGLDQESRYALLDLLEEIAQEKLCTLLYVSHREDEHRSFFKQHIQLKEYV